ncbi:hypothetical protein ACP70R_033453 [Stipagrostis hirtigluma subsp. patula]
MADNREWMYSEWKQGRPPTDERLNAHAPLCRNFVRHKRQTIEMHLFREGFKENYSSWTAHGEGRDGHDQDNISAIGEGLEQVDHMDYMLSDMADGYHLSEQEPTASAQAFYKMVASTSTMSISHPFWPGKQVMCKKIGMSIPPEILASWESQQRHSSGSHMGNPDDRQQEDMENEWNTWFVGENMDLDRSFILLLAD